MHSNGDRVLCVRQQAEDSPPHAVRVVISWFEELRRITCELERAFGQVPRTINPETLLNSMLRVKEHCR
jgi:hypothetical protein